MTDQGEYSVTQNGTHVSVWSGKQVLNKPTVMSLASQAQTELGVIGVLALVIGTWRADRGVKITSGSSGMNVGRRRVVVGG